MPKASWQKTASLREIKKYIKFQCFGSWEDCREGACECGGVHSGSKSFHPNDLLIHSSFTVTSALQCESDNVAQKQVKIVTND